MKVLFGKAFWGMTEGRTLDEKCRICKEAGYDAVEFNVLDYDPVAIKATTEKHALKYIAQIFPMTADELPGYLDKASAAGAIKAVSHSGRDKWSREVGDAYWSEVLTIQEDYSIPVAHETHRHRLFYAPWTAGYYLEKFPDLRVTLDLSHWCCVCESLLDDMPRFVDLAICRAIHIHARIGHEEGPQVSDPSAPEWKLQRDKHLGWWDRVRAAREKDGTAVLTITPEFGPPHYCQLIPHTGMPVVDLWKVNLWMRDHLKARWSV